MTDRERRSAPEKSPRKLEKTGLPDKKISRIRRGAGEAAVRALEKRLKNNPNPLRMGPTHSGHREGDELVVRYPGPSRLPPAEWTSKGMIGPFPGPNGPVNLDREDDDDDI